MQRALAEDVGAGDVTSEATVPPMLALSGVITQKEAGVIYGLDAAALAFTLLDPDAEVEALAVEGAWREPGEAVLRVSGSARALLAGERTALNFLAHLSGIATLTARCVRELVRHKHEAAGHTEDDAGVARAREGRGAGRRGRATTASAFMTRSSSRRITSRSRAESARPSRRLGIHAPNRLLEVEVCGEAEVDIALAAGAPRLLLDNMSPARAARRRQACCGARGARGERRCEPRNLREIAASGVDFVSMGALTHSAPALDLSMILEPLSG